MFRHYDFDPLDLLIIHAVLNANVLNILKDSELDRRFGSVQTVEPDEIKQGVSVPVSHVFWLCPWRPSGDAPID